MSEIGATLQSARTRAGLDISDIEAETKIRAKYLRALEQEEWDQLPGATYVRSFLRTYADALGLDGRMMVEQFRLRHEHPTDQDLMPILPQRRSSGRQEGRKPPRGAVIALLVVAVLLVGLSLVARARRRRRRGRDASGTRPATGRHDGNNREPWPGTTSAPAAAESRLQIIERLARFSSASATRPGKIVVDGVTLADGERPRGPQERGVCACRLGNGDARLVVNGRSRGVADASPQAYRVSSFGVKPIALERSPACTPG